MARTLLVATFLLGITCVLAANSTNSSMPIPSPAATSMPLPSPAATSMSPSMSPSSSSSSPSPSPSPYPPTWEVHDGNNKTCIMMKARVSVKTKFLVNETTKEEQTVSFNVTKDATVSMDSLKTNVSSCGASSSSLTLQWNTTTNTTNPVFYSLTFYFESNSTLQTWELNKVAVSFKVVDNPVFDNYINPTFQAINGVLESQLASAMMNQSYLCNANSSNPLAVATNGTFNVTVDISDMTVQAFHFTNDTKFDTYKDCKADTPGKKGKGGGNNKVVPIAVGAALAGLVVIVLVAYLIGRFRSRKSSSYEPLS